MPFRYKVLFLYGCLFVLVLGVLYPLSLKVIKRIVISGLEERVTEVIEEVKTEPDNENLVKRLKQIKPRIFFRVGVISDESKILYDTHIRRLFGVDFSQEYVVDHPEVKQAFAVGEGYSEAFSALLGQDFIYIARQFDFHGKPYVLRMAFPSAYVIELTEDVNLAIFGLTAAVLFLYSFLTWGVINYLTRPIQKVITAVSAYQEGEAKSLPHIEMQAFNPQDDFGKLALTLNSLSKKVQQQIDTLTQERNEKQAVLESLVEGVVACDRNFNVLYANEMALYFLGVKREEFVGCLFSEAAVEADIGLLQECYQKKSPCKESYVVKRNGEKLYLDFVAAPLRENLGVILVIQDSSAHYKMLEMRKEFVANASHELKTPITIMHGFAETLHENPDLKREMIQDITEKIVKNCVRMDSLITDLLALADIEKISPARLVFCDLFDLMEQSKTTVLKLFPDAEISLLKAEGVHSQSTVDPQLMEMAFFNLIQNGAKYSNPPAKITVTFEEREGEMEICISDQGLGIPKEELPYIFQRFYRVSKESARKKGGTGLGLSIVETIIDKHGGRISVDSKEGKGTTFAIRLPIKR